MKKVKPILTIGIPVKNLEDSDVDRLIDSFHETIGSIEELRQQYFVFIFTDRENDNMPEFKVFYDKDFNEVQYKEFQKIILEKVNGKK